MTQIGINVSRGASFTLDATDEFTPWVSVGESRAGLVVICIVFNSSWNGTIRFDGAVKVDDTMTADPIAGTNLLNGTTVASTTVGAVSTTEFWRVDASALDGVRAYASTVTAGACTVTYTWTIG